LSNFAIDLINSTGGLLAFGVSGLQPNDPIFGVGVAVPSKLNLDLDENTQVPAPATLALFGLGLACLGWTRRRRI
jgi:hypothetical protein